MNNGSPVEKIYIGRVVDSDKASQKGKFAVHHIYQFSHGINPCLHINYGLSREALEGYLEGATATIVPYVREVLNGIPDYGEKGSFLGVKVEKISFIEFVSIIEEAGLERKSRQMQVRLSPSI